MSAALLAAHFFHGTHVCLFLTALMAAYFFHSTHGSSFLPQHSWQCIITALMVAYFFHSTHGCLFLPHHSCLLIFPMWSWLLISSAALMADYFFQLLIFPQRNRGVNLSLPKILQYLVCMQTFKWFSAFEFRYNPPQEFKHVYAMY